MVHLKACTLILLCLWVGFAHANEPWKGQPDPGVFNFGAFAGLGSVKGELSVPLRAFVAIKILDEGFVSGINNQVYIEAQAGPVTRLDSNYKEFDSSLGVRWMFQYSPAIAYYALAGISGTYSNDALRNTAPGWISTVDIGGYLGAGLEWKLCQAFRLRAEATYKMLGVGVSFAL